MSSIKLPFGLKNDRLVEVSEVLSGKRCGCVCPGCKKDLIAKKGEVNAHHFAHDHTEDSDNCKYGAETAIHKMAKQIISEEKAIFAPSKVIEKIGTDRQLASHSVSREVHPEGPLFFDHVECEQVLGDIKPDVIARRGEQQFIIEVAVTHFCDRDKVSACRKKGYNVLEVDLKAFTEKLPTKKDLRAYILGEVAGREWLTLEAYPEVEKLVDEELRKQIDEANSRFAASVKASAHPPKLPPIPPEPIPKWPKTQSYRGKESERWFVCSICKESQKSFPNGKDLLPEEVYLFSCTLEEAPLGIATVTCPFCNSPVTAN